MSRLLYLLFGIALLFSAPTAARDADGVAYMRTAPASLDATKAYLLLRSSTAKSGMMSIRHVLLRVPTDQEISAYRAAKEAAYQADLPSLIKKAKGAPAPTIDQYSFDYAGPTNMFDINSNEFLEDGEMRTFLVEVPAGTYILYGSSVGGVGLSSCNCLGTVKFDAQPGMITNLGSLYIDKVHKPSPIPHLEDNIGPSMFQYGFVIGQGLVPADDTTPVPAVLAGLKTIAAEYHAVGLFHEPGAAGINRLAPVPGILGYDRGKVIDLRTGQPVN